MDHNTSHPHDWSCSHSPIRDTKKFTYFLKLLLKLLHTKKSGIAVVPCVFCGKLLSFPEMYYRRPVNISYMLSSCVVARVCIGLVCEYLASYGVFICTVIALLGYGLSMLLIDRIVTSAVLSFCKWKMLDAAHVEQDRAKRIVLAKIKHDNLHKQEIASTGIIFAGVLFIEPLRFIYFLPIEAAIVFVKSIIANHRKLIWLSAIAMLLSAGGILVLHYCRSELYVICIECAAAGIITYFVLSKNDERIS